MKRKRSCSNERGKSFFCCEMIKLIFFCCDAVVVGLSIFFLLRGGGSSKNFFVKTKMSGAPSCGSLSEAERKYLVDRVARMKSLMKSIREALEAGGDIANWKNLSPLSREVLVSRMRSELVSAYQRALRDAPVVYSVMLWHMMNGIPGRYGGQSACDALAKVLNSSVSSEMVQRIKQVMDQEIRDAASDARMNATDFTRTQVPSFIRVPIEYIGPFVDQMVNEFMKCAMTPDSSTLEPHFKTLCTLANTFLLQVESMAVFANSKAAMRSVTAAGADPDCSAVIRRAFIGYGAWMTTPRAVFGPKTDAFFTGLFSFAAILVSAIITFARKYVYEPFMSTTKHLVWTSVFLMVVSLCCGFLENAEEARDRRVRQRIEGAVKTGVVTRDTIQEVRQFFFHGLPAVISQEMGVSTSLANFLIDQGWMDEKAADPSVRAYREFSRVVQSLMLRLDATEKLPLAGIPMPGVLDVFNMCREDAVDAGVAAGATTFAERLGLLNAALKLAQQQPAVAAAVSLVVPGTFLAAFPTITGNVARNGGSVALGAGVGKVAAELTKLHPATAPLSTPIAVGVGALTSGMHAAWDCISDEKRLKSLQRQSMLAEIVRKEYDKLQSAAEAAAVANGMTYEQASKRSMDEVTIRDKALSNSDLFNALMTVPSMQQLAGAPFRVVGRAVKEVATSPYVMAGGAATYAAGHVLSRLNSWANSRLGRNGESGK